MSDDRFYNIEVNWHKDGALLSMPLQNVRVSADTSAEAVIAGANPSAWTQHLREIYGDELAASATFRATPITAEEYYPH
jgi:hypothetical protein